MSEACEGQDGQGDALLDLFALREAAGDCSMVSGSAAAANAAMTAAVSALPTCRRHHSAFYFLVIAGRFVAGRIVVLADGLLVALARHLVRCISHLRTQRP